MPAAVILTPDLINILTSLIGIITPVIVDGIRGDEWSKQRTLLAALITSTVLYIVLNLALGALTYPVSQAFLVGLLGAFTVQQTAYTLVYKDRNPATPPPAAPTGPVEASLELKVGTTATTATPPLDSGTDIPKGSVS